jgi:hypothetical protein
MISKRLLEAFAMLVIGDSMLCVLSPERHVALWVKGPNWWERSLEPLERKPDLTRALGLAGIGFGFWLASQQRPRRQLTERAR